MTYNELYERMSIRSKLDLHLTPMELIRLKVEVRELYQPFIDYAQPYPIGMELPRPKWPAEFDGLDEDEIKELLCL